MITADRVMEHRRVLTELRARYQMAAAVTFTAICMLKFKQKTLDVQSEILDALVSFLPIFLQRLFQDAIKLERQIRQKMADRLRLFINDLCHRVGRRLALERYVTYKQLVQDNAQTPDIGPLIYV